METENFQTRRKKENVQKTRKNVIISFMLQLAPMYLNYDTKKNVMLMSQMTFMTDRKGMNEAAREISQNFNLLFRFFLTIWYEIKSAIKLIASMISYWKWTQHWPEAIFLRIPRRQLMLPFRMNVNYRSVHPVSLIWY